MKRHIFSGMLLAFFPVVSVSSANPFEGREVREVLTSSESATETQRCMMGSGISAYPIRFEEGRRTVFFLTLQSLSGRNPQAWELIDLGDGSQLKVYDGRRYLKRALHCFERQDSSQS